MNTRKCPSKYSQYLQYSQYSSPFQTLDSHLMEQQQQQEQEEEERWYVFYSERHQRHYYHQPTTGCVQWALPESKLISDWMKNGTMMIKDPNPDTGKDESRSVWASSYTCQNKRKVVRFDLSPSPSSSSKSCALSSSSKLLSPSSSSSLSSTSFSSMPQDEYKLKSPDLHLQLHSLTLQDQNDEIKVSNRKHPSYSSLSSSFHQQQKAPSTTTNRPDFPINASESSTLTCTSTSSPISPSTEISASSIESTSTSTSLCKSYRLCSYRVWFQKCLPYVMVMCVSSLSTLLVVLHILNDSHQIFFYPQNHHHHHNRPLPTDVSSVLPLRKNNENRHGHGNTNSDPNTNTNTNSNHRNSSGLHCSVFPNVHPPYHPPYHPPTHPYLHNHDHDYRRPNYNCNDSSPQPSSSPSQESQPKFDSITHTEVTMTPSLLRSGKDKGGEKGKGEAFTCVPSIPLESTGNIDRADAFLEKKYKEEEEEEKEEHKDKDEPQQSSNTHSQQKLSNASPVKQHPPPTTLFTSAFWDPFGFLSSSSISTVTTSSTPLLLEWTTFPSTMALAATPIYHFDSYRVETTTSTTSKPPKLSRSIWTFPKTRWNPRNIQAHPTNVFFPHIIHHVNDDDKEDGISSTTQSPPLSPPPSQPLSKPQIIQNQPRRKLNRCDIPLAYLISSTCRRQAHDMPLFPDLEWFLWHDFT